LFAADTNDHENTHIRKITVNHWLILSMDAQPYLVDKTDPLRSIYYRSIGYINARIKYQMH